MMSPRPAHQLALPVAPAAEERPRDGALASVQAALATADRAALAAHLAGGATASQWRLATTPRRTFLIQPSKVGGA